MTGWPLPDRNDALTAPHWRAASEGRLEMQRCTACGHVRWPAARSCPQCLAEGGVWTPLSGRGTLWSFAIYDRPLHPALEGACPYAVGLIQLAEGPTVYGRLDGPVDGHRVGDPVEARFETLAEGIGIPRFYRRIA